MSSSTMGPIPFPPSNGSRLGARLHVKGEISGSEDLEIDGSVDGLIQIEGRKLTVGSGAKIVADVMAAEVIVGGSIKGNLCARKRLEITKDGSLIGELTTERIKIEDGAYFKGLIEIDRKNVGTIEGGGDVRPEPVELGLPPSLKDTKARPGQYLNDGTKPNPAAPLSGGTPTLVLPPGRK